MPASFDESGTAAFHGRRQIHTRLAIALHGTSRQLPGPATGRLAPTVVVGQSGETSVASPLGGRGLLAQDLISHNPVDTSSVFPDHWVASEIPQLAPQKSIMNSYESTNQKIQAVAELLGLCIPLGFGLLVWGLIAGFAGWLASAFGEYMRLPVFYAWLALYLFVTISVVRRWIESRSLFGLPDGVRGKYIGTALSLPLELIGRLAAIGAFLLWGWQVVYWLRTDVWIPLDIVSLVTPIRDGEPLGPRAMFMMGGGPSGNHWLIAPRDWYGLHKIAHFVLSIVTPSLIFLGAGLAAMTKATLYSDLRLRIQALSHASMPHGNDAGEGT